MIKKNYIYLAFSISIFVHIAIFFNLRTNNDIRIKEILVLDLSSHKEFIQPIVTQPKKQKIFEEKKKIEKKIEPPKKEVLPKKKEIIKKLPEKNVIPIKKPDLKLEKKTTIKETKKKIDSPKKNIEKPLNIKKSQTIQNIKDKQILINKEMASFLNLISSGINMVAAKSYPKQSIRRGEQGTINVLITLNKEGKMMNMDFLNKRPKRLHDATEKILKNYEFPTPPQVLMDKSNLLKIKIPVNFILR